MNTNKLHYCGRAPWGKTEVIKELPDKTACLFNGLVDIQQNEKKVGILLKDKLIIYNHDTNLSTNINSQAYTTKINSKKLSCGVHHFLVLQDGVPYGYSCTSTEAIACKEIGKLCEISYFPKNGINIVDLKAGAFASYFLSDKGVLYGCGTNNEGELGDGSNTTAHNPKVIAKKIKNFWTGRRSSFLFYQNDEDEIYSVGSNTYGQLGINSLNKMSIPKKVTLRGQIIDIQASYGHTLALTEYEGKHELYSCGFHIYNGLNKNNNTESFEKINFFEGFEILQISIGNYANMILAINKDGERNVYGFGYNDDKLLGSFPHSQRTVVNLSAPKIINQRGIKISCGVKSAYYFLTKSCSIVSDLENLYKSKEFSDYEFYGKPVHQKLIELRTGLKIDKVVNVFKDSDQETIEFFLRWVYTDYLNSSKSELLDTFTQMGINSPVEKTVEKDFINWYKDEDSKDFNIIVIDDDDEEEEEPEEIEIPVHKLILIIRSGLFREMFKNTKTTNSIQDYSRKSEDAYDVLIKFLYTEKIEVDADVDVELLLDELEDSVEYFQLNPSSNFKSQLDQLQSIRN
ncbi:btk-binding protein-related [Anaeramoeba flamelloides]|uniref:Btk-binding protein-related n=1 Tax=Anaeramoeba flamelloides TaxID=1746091 RepID=A0ABQ8X1T6_9EUKA|nr:btk-binding protein-related [Anaeramoeba flamelloides]